MALAVYGKHPAKGDFLEHGIPAALKPALERWLDTVLAEAKSALGSDWQAVWPAAPMLRFWVGEGIWGSALAGVMAPAQDRVGRRFPLVLLALGDAGVTLPPPMIDSDQSWYDATCVHLGTQLLRNDLLGPAALIEDAPLPAITDALPGPRDFWATRPGADVAELLADIALTDHRRASEARSYWWVAGTTVPIFAGSDPVMPHGEEPPAAPQADTTDPVGDDIAADLPDNLGAELTRSDTQSAQMVWGASDVPEIDASPFEAVSGKSSLFASPEPGTLGHQAIGPAPVALIPTVPRQTWSQVWAGAGLPSGEVLAWFFRGHAGND